MIGMLPQNHPVNYGLEKTAASVKSKTNLGATESYKSSNENL